MCHSGPPALGRHGLRESLIAKSGWNELDHTQWSHPNYSQNILRPLHLRLSLIGDLRNLVEMPIGMS